MTQRIRLSTKAEMARTISLFCASFAGPVGIQSSRRVLALELGTEVLEPESIAQLYLVGEESDEQWLPFKF